MHAVPALAMWHKQNNGDLKPIAFASQYLNDAEKILSGRTRTAGGSLGPGTT